MPDEIIRLVDPKVSSTHFQKSWFQDYLGRLSRSSDASKLALELDSRAVLDRVTDGLRNWQGVPVTGLVVGAVQSGKTASMIAVSCLALDQGFNIVVIVSGTRTSLWQQTLSRAIRDMDGDGDARVSSYAQRKRRVWIPTPETPISSSDSPRSLFSVSLDRGQRCLREKRPIIAVVMKQGDHLTALKDTIRTITEGSTDFIKMLVIDDEADDGSILNVTSEADTPRYLPKWIEALWATGPRNPNCFTANLRVAYIAYTATPQANFLQDAHNPLSPRNFSLCIRTPDDMGDPARRESPTYRVAAISDRHIGGRYFYPSDEQAFNPCFRLQQNAELIRDGAPTPDNREILGKAIRYFIVAAACRLIESGGSYRRAKEVVAEEREVVLSVTPPVSSMLFNPSASIDSHFAGEWQIWSWVHSDEPPIFSAQEELEIDRPNIDWSIVSNLIDNDLQTWVDCLSSYRESHRLLRRLPGCGGLVAPPLDWSTVKQTIVDEILPCLSTQVINSSPSADIPPQFDPIRRPDDKWVAARDLCTIFVAGNVMSRGLTLEGLVTTVFLRDPSLPLADSQMQMQRWFGYRGSYFHYFRDFLYENQFNLFQKYHAADDVLRRELMAAESTNRENSDSPQILGGNDFSVTGKVQYIHQLPLSPGPSPFIAGFWEGDGPDPNLALLERLFGTEEYEAVRVDSDVKGLIIKRKFTLLEIANLLDLYTFQLHNPLPTDAQHKRWASFETLSNGVIRVDSLFRPNVRDTRRTHQSDDKFSPKSCPYSIAAYLRLWNAMPEVSIPGLMSNDRYLRPWSFLTDVQRGSRIPKVSIGLRFGNGDFIRGTAIDKVGLALGDDSRIRLMDRSFDLATCRLKGTWGTRNQGGDATYLGDQYFDYHRSSGTKDVVVGSWRQIGEDALVLFHLFQGPNEHVRLATGLCLPLGGPDQIAVLRGEF